MLDTKNMNSQTVGEMAGGRLSVATLGKVCKAYSYDLTGAGRYVKQYFENALVSRFDDAQSIYAELPDTACNEVQDAYTVGFFVGYLAAVEDTERLHNAITKSVKE